MDDEDVQVRITFEPMLHDRWSLLSFVATATSEMAQTVADNFQTLAIMSIQHAKQKMYDKRFKEITNDDALRARSVQSED